MGILSFGMIVGLENNTLKAKYPALYIRAGKEKNMYGSWATQWHWIYWKLVYMPNKCWPCSWVQSPNAWYWCYSHKIKCRPNLSCTSTRWRIHSGSVMKQNWKQTKPKRKWYKNQLGETCSVKGVNSYMESKYWEDSFCYCS